jgi:hypothetical protein
MQEGIYHDENEYFYLAFAAFNVANKNVSHVHAKLMTPYSSVVDKTPLADFSACGSGLILPFYAKQGKFQQYATIRISKDEHQ